MILPVVVRQVLSAPYVFLPVSCTAGEAFILFRKEECDLVNLYVFECECASVFPG